MADDARAQGGTEQKGESWFPLVILGAAQFVMVLDTSVMNVSISQIVDDLDTTIQGVQLAITAYTLVMAAFMLLGAKLGDVWGRDRAFAIGLAVYGVGSLTTAFSPNLGVLLFGWSLIEGLGAVLVIPAIAALVAANYSGRRRALAFGLIGGIAAVAVAAGPLIGGWVTSNLSWRYVFAAETVVVIGILAVRRKMRSAPPPARRPKLDGVGAALSAIGLALVVYAILRSSEWGWVRPKDPPVIGDHEITPFGFAPTLWLILAGLAVLAAFAWWLGRRERRGQDPLLDLALLRIVPLRAGLQMLLSQQLLLMGTFFVLPVYLQVVLGFDAFETGVRLLPLSVGMLIAALSGPRIAEKTSPRLVVRCGLGAVAISSLMLLGTVDVELDAPALRVALAVFGVGAGLLASQLGNVIMSSVDPSRGSEAGGLQGTAQNLGASLGTALVGAVLLIGLSGGFQERLLEAPGVSAETREQVADATASGIDIIPVDQAEQALRDAGVSADESAAIADAYGQAQVDGLEDAFLIVALLAIAAFWFTRHIPSRPMVQPDAASGDPDAAGPPDLSAGGR
ncbi:MAG: MFS transporter [Thermoleophilia bacterium]